MTYLTSTQLAILTARCGAIRCGASRMGFNPRYTVQTFIPQTMIVAPPNLPLSPAAIPPVPTSFGASPWTQVLNPNPQNN